MPPAENSKELCTPEPVPDPGECSSRDAQIVGAGPTDAAGPSKGDAAPAVPVTPADATC